MQPETFPPGSLPPGMRPVSDIARELGCCEETVRRMLREDAVPGVKIGRVWKADPARVMLALSNAYQGPQHD